VLVSPPERRSHFKATVEILLCGERGRGKACLSICASYIHSQAAYTSQTAGYIWGSNVGTHGSAGGNIMAAVDQQPGRVQSPTGGSGTAKLSSTAQ